MPAPLVQIVPLSAIVEIYGIEAGVAARADPALGAAQAAAYWTDRRRTAGAAAAWRALHAGRASEAVGAFGVAVGKAFAGLDRALTEARLTKKPGMVFDGMLPGTASSSTPQKPPSRQALPLGRVEAVAAIDPAVLRNRWRRELAG